MHDRRIEQAAADYLERVDTRPGQPWSRGEVQRNLVAFAEHVLRSWPCPYCKGDGMIEVELLCGSFDEARCPCGAEPRDEDEDSEEGSGTGGSSDQTGRGSTG
jgi:hypothetical protein